MYNKIIKNDMDNSVFNNRYYMDNTEWENV